MTRHRIGRTMLTALSCLLAAGLLCAGLASASPARGAATVTPASTALNPNRPASAVKLIFIHHSTGEAWLADAYGGLAPALRANNYFVSDTNYGWGPGGIGSNTDIGDWWTWFRGPSSATYMAELFAESGTHSTYSRLASDPGGQNTVVVFKSCFPNSNLDGPLGPPVPAIIANPMKGRSAGDPSYTVANAKGIYSDLLPYFAAHTDKLFVLVVSPPETYLPHPSNARALADWLVSPSGWLSGYAYANVAVFDYYNVLTAPANHHRYNAALGVVEDIHPTASDVLAYPTGDSHPSAAGDRKATAEFVPILNIAYNRWRAGIRPPAPAVPRCVVRTSSPKARLSRSTRLR